VRGLASRKYNFQKKAGLDNSTVSRLESGKRNPTAGVVDALAAALELSGVEADWLRVSAGFRGKGNVVSHHEKEIWEANDLVNNDEVPEEDKEEVRSAIRRALGEIATRQSLRSQSEE